MTTATATAEAQALAEAFAQLPNYFEKDAPGADYGFEVLGALLDLRFLVFVYAWDQTVRQVDPTGRVRKVYTFAEARAELTAAGIEPSDAPF